MKWTKLTLSFQWIHFRKSTNQLYHQHLRRNHSYLAENIYKYNRENWNLGKATHTTSIWSSSLQMDVYCWLN